MSTQRIAPEGIDSDEGAGPHPLVTSLQRDVFGVTLNRRHAEPQSRGSGAPELRYEARRADSRDVTAAWEELEPEWLSPEPRSTNQERFVSVVGRWVGRIIEIDDDTFTAVVSDTMNHNPDEEVVILLDDLSRVDREIAEPGSMFTWVLGYRENDRGQRFRSSFVRVAPRTPMTRRSAATASNWARSVTAAFGDISNEIN